MQRMRRHERIALVADVTIQPGEEHPARFAGKVFNVSKGGVAVFSERAFALGKLAGLALSLPDPQEGDRKVTLFGVTRWVEVRPEGNIVGIELLADRKAGDYQQFCDYLERHCGAGRDRDGFTIVETIIAMVIICLLATLAMPIFKRSIEQARADTAAASLKTVWSAQRIYWLECRSYSPNLSLLKTMDLIDSAVADSASNANAVYVYEISSADQGSFVATASRHNGGVWSGELSLDQTGQIAGTITGPGGQVLAPAP